MPVWRPSAGDCLRAFCRVLVFLALTTFRAFGSPASPRIPVILISVDTLRADHLGSYGYRQVPTPAIDSLVSGGTRFSRASSQVPLTLPSHASLFTSTYPFSNRVQDNGEVLPAGLPTLASVFKTQGYATAAFIGGFALDSRFGLDQGFDVYDSPFDTNQDVGTDPAALKRPGEEVARAAENWIGQHSTGPFFLFLHLYDLHTPYQPHENQAVPEGIGGYDAELAYTDRVLGQFFAFLRERGLFDKALIVFLADHGESLGEHGESTHGYFIYESTLHVPLIVHWPSAPALPPLVSEPVGLIQVSPTVLQYLGLPVPAQFQGTGLLSASAKSPPPSSPGVYSESVYAHNHYDCAALKGLIAGQFHYIDAPSPELYDLQSDPEEVHNLYAQRRSLGHSLRDRLLAMQRRFPANVAKSGSAVSPATAEQLRALGYLPSSGSANAASLDFGIDPKDRIVAYEQTHQAIAMAYAGKLSEAVALLEKTLAAAPGLTETRNLLGLFQQKLGLHEKAAENFRIVLRADPANGLAHYNLAVSEFNLGHDQEAIREVEALRLLAANPQRALQQVAVPAEELLGTIFLQQKEYARARAQFEHVLSLAPRDFDAHYNLGWMAGQEGNLAEGVQHLRLAVQINPGNADAHSALGSLLLRQGDLAGARDQFSETIRLSPDSAPAHYNLGLVLARQDEPGEAASEFRRALQADPNFTRARDALDKIGKHE